MGSKLIEFNAAQVGCVSYYFVGMYYVPNLMYAVFVGLRQELKNSWLSFVWVATYNYASLPMII
jgi:hypothetical protein